MEEKLKLDPQLKIDENPCDKDHIEDDVETPSLCDLPVIKHVKEELPDQRNNDDDEAQDDQDFEFGSLRADGSLLSLEDDMCVADDIFFDGQILPLRHSISSIEKIHHKLRNNNNNNTDNLVRTGSGSLESTDRSGSISSSGYRSSSYTNSCRSSSFGSSGKSAGNPFHSYPSPSPQIRACPGTRSVPTKNPSSKSTLWELLRLGLVRAPPELPPRRSMSYCYGQKVISRSSSSSSSSTINGNNCRVKKVTASENLGAKRSGIFGGCKSSVDVIRSGGCGGEAAVEGGKSEGREEERRWVERRRRHRTFEWLKGVTDHGVELNDV